MLRLLEDCGARHLGRTLFRPQRTREQFIQLRAAIGRPHAIYHDGELARFY